MHHAYLLKVCGNVYGRIYWTETESVLNTVFHYKFDKNEDGT